MHTLKINDKKYQLKSQWAELTKKEMLMLCHVLRGSTFKNDADTANACRMAAFKVLSGVPLLDVADIAAEQWADIFPFLNWIFDAHKMRENDFPKMRMGRRTLCGPVGNSMETSSAMELISADTALINMAKNGDTAQLYRIAAILWRPKARFAFLKRLTKDWNGDVRKPLNRLDIINRAAKMEKKLDPDLLMYTFLYYKSFRENVFIARHRSLFPKDGETKKNKGIDFGWHGVLLEFSNDKFGDYKNTAATNWQLFFQEMTRQKEQANLKK